MTREKKEYRKRIDLEYPDRSKEALDLQKKIMKLIDDLDKLGYEFIWFNNQSSIRHKRGIK
jgi:histidinol phosphatase-like enzyme